MGKFSAVIERVSHVHDQQKPLCLIGPVGSALPNGERVARSKFIRYYRSGCSTSGPSTGWRWAAFDAQDQVVQVVEVPDILNDCHSTPLGALWTARGIAAHYCRSDVRSHKGH